jgi:hypothetical protein
MINRRRTPGKGGMTVVTGLSAGHVPRGLTSRDGAIMTTTAPHGSAFENAS